MKSQYNVYNLFLAKLILLLVFWDDVTYLTLELEKTIFRFNCSQRTQIHFERTMISLSSRKIDHQMSVFYSSLYFYTSNTFRPILARFSHILVYTNFFLMCFSTQNMFLIPDDAVARNLTIIFNFSSQRPHLNYIFYSLIQWNFP